MYGCGNTNLVIWTVGHSTLSFQEFFEFLAGHRIERLADVRRFPASQRVPWATKQVLAAALRDRGIDYEHFEDLGGFRKPMVDSRNTGWRNAGFRGYADYMSSSEFGVGLDRLIRLAGQRRTAIMCAEVVPWKCHRSLISDSLVARGIPVEHIISSGKTEHHQLTKFAKVEGPRVTYPGP
ncbi:MAG: DUF488 domain-containing protein [Methanobacteriota archaeon]|nr:MAG: DUF488 domain-containing protein [Euryarchaeota archaeon]TLZ97078.1 MAG: DUF488 domain-containing protein [Euryarchaeota archaeon]